VSSDPVAMIDEALGRFGGREIISSAELCDFLLDLRLCLVPLVPDSVPDEEALAGA